MDRGRNSYQCNESHKQTEHMNRMIVINGDKFLHTKIEV